MCHVWYTSSRFAVLQNLEGLLTIAESGVQELVARTLLGLIGHITANLRVLRARLRNTPKDVKRLKISKPLTRSATCIDLGFLLPIGCTV
jgi:hypothetical protein